jgi:hypothetical protein
MTCVENRPNDVVIPVKAGIRPSPRYGAEQNLGRVPAFAGMT